MDQPQRRRRLSELDLIGMRAPKLGYIKPMFALLLACSAKSSDPITHEDAEWNDIQMWKAFDELVDIGLPNVYEAFEQYTMLYDEGATLDCPRWLQFQLPRCSGQWVYISDGVLLQWGC